MAKIVRKLFGNKPENVHVLSEIAEFDNEGLAEVSDEAAEVFAGCPGYELVETKKASEDKDPEDEDKDKDPEDEDKDPEDEDKDDEENDDKDDDEEEEDKKVEPMKRKAPPKRARK